MKRQTNFMTTFFVTSTVALNFIPESFAAAPASNRTFNSASDLTSNSVPANASATTVASKLQAQVVFAPTKDVETAGSLAKVLTPKGSVAYIVGNNRNMAIFCLESSSEGVSVQIPGEKAVVLGPGRELLLTQNKEAVFEEVNPGRRIGYRNPTELQSINAYKAFLVDFSISSVVAACKPLGAIVANPNPQLQKLCEGILKNCEILAEPSNSKQPFKFPDTDQVDLIDSRGRSDPNRLTATQSLRENLTMECSGQKFPLEGKVTVEEGSGQSLFSSGEFSPNVLEVLAKDGIVFGSGSKSAFLELLKGNVFFMPQSDITVQTHAGIISIPRGAAAWIMENGVDVAVYVFDDKRRVAPVKVVANSKPFFLAPGTELVITNNSTDSFDILNPGSGAIGYLNLLSADLGQGLKTYVCDFSIPHGLANIEVVHKMLFSTDRLQKKLVHQMLKNAIILADLTGYDYRLPDHQ